MLLTITNRTSPARELGHLLRKHPDRIQSFYLSFGRATVCFPQAEDDVCTAALLLDIDPITLVRGSGSSQGGLFEAYVTDRAYAASSFTSVAMAKLFSDGIHGRVSKTLTDPEKPRDLEAGVLPITDDRDLAERLFAPLGYTVQTTQVDVPDAAKAGMYYHIKISAITTLQAMLTHLYVLIPVLDGRKHYWVGDDEAEKLLERGGDWLPNHPEREVITRRYLKRAPQLARTTLARLQSADENANTEGAPQNTADSEKVLERPLRLQDVRMETVATELQQLGVKTVADLGCGEGDLLCRLVKDMRYTSLLGTDVAISELRRARERIETMNLPYGRSEAVQIFQSSLTYLDRRIKGYDAATLLEVIEHVDADRLSALEHIVFTELHLPHIIVTTPNKEYNALFPRLFPNGLRHTDHRFEWTRAEFTAWSEAVAERRGYNVRFLPIGETHSEFGAPTQMAVFSCK